ncbi:MAG: dipeptidase [Acidobacteria bacterium]|nr:dipeptidase [Acidobacteriota bacterium]MDA1235656.1 dipeptidase [Acidobacteriota bacterium]
MQWTRREWTLAVAGGAAACTQAPQAEETTTTVTPEDLLAQSYVIDLHCDTPDRLAANSFDLGEDYAYGQVDIPKMRKGGVSGVFFAVYNSGARGATPEKYEDALKIIDLVKTQVARHADDLVLATTADNIVAAKQAGKIAILMGVEGGHTIDSSLDHLRHLYELGSRYMTLTHGVHLPWAGSSGDVAEEDPGLTDFGREVVAEMNRLGMMVDVSHVSDKTFAGVMEAAKAPMIASHSSCRALSDHPRNMTDDMIKAVAGRGGVVHINFYNAFLDPDYRSRSAAYEDPTERNEDETVEAGWARRMRKLETVGRTPFSVLLDHFEHAVKVGGVDHVGLGSDFDGVTEELPTGMEDISKIPNLISGLRERGFADEAISKILGGNTLRVMREVETYAHASKESA